ncbi:MAG TPA: hypothetical protein VFL47_12440 [Flavisolibacter sp.]|nr:hypothetical protein [Flavisolibacter sp.]
MKRLFLCFGFAATLLIAGSCAQHDPNSADTSGAAPYGSGGANKVGIDTVATPNDSAANFPDMEQGTNNNMRNPNNTTSGDAKSNRADTIHRQ